VKAKLFDDNTLRGIGISVDTFGGDVSLTGAVENAKAVVATGVESNKATGASETFPASTDKV
jgi:osmotically-inducible protein OsmY